MKDARFDKFVVLVNGLVPLAMLGWDAYWHHLGANPIEFAIRTTGMMALIFLLLTLAVTPARKILDWNYFSHFRRMLGLFAFFYGSMHFLIYLGFYQSFSVPAVIADTARRPFILFGMTALFLMTPLAVTSTNGMIRRLGAARWKKLHRLIYISAASGVTHYWLLVKADTRKPLALAAVLGTLLLFRLMVRKPPVRPAEG
jgi:DMSO/TMAO reductase YedYZ heme-binding membrane subunit